MKTLKITTHWTAEEADCIYQFLDELKGQVWQLYGEEIIEMHQTIRVQQQRIEKSEEFDEDILF